MQDDNDRRKQFSVLCIDDERNLLESYLQVLSGKGDILSLVLDDPRQQTNSQVSHCYRIFTAESGEDAVRIVQDEMKKGNRFAAAFFDIRMPGGMDGYETIREIRTIDPEMYCAVVTAYTDRNPEQIRKLFANGYQDHFLYFKKPFSAVELEQTALFLTSSWERKRKEKILREELRQAKNDWEEVFNTIDEAITVHDLSYTILRSNKASQKLLQVGPDTLDNAKCFAMYHGQNQPPENCPTCQTVQSGIPSKSQFYEPYLRRHIEMKALPRFNHCGELTGIIHIAKDISEQKKSEAALRESEERFRELAELLPVGIFEMDLHARITFANKCTFDYFGYAQQDLEQGVYAHNFVSPADRLRAERNLAGIAGGGPAMLNEYEAVRRDGTTFPIVIRTAMIIREGKHLGFRGIIMDVSEKKQLESRLFQSQKIEAVGTLAGGIAHDFNNILTGILGYSELLLMGADKENPTYGYLSEIRSSGKRAANLIKQILTFSRQDEVKMQPIQILPVLKDALRLIRAVIPTTIDIRQTIEPICEKALILGEQTQLHQIIMNLCTNASHAMRESGGVLEIKISMADLDGKNDRLVASGLLPGRYCRIDISDTGKGMDKTLLGRIFEPYFTTKKRGEGTGLGLAITDSIVKKFGGDIFVSSAPDKGTTFEIYLPVILASAGAERGEVVLDLPGGPEKIMFIDDEETIVHMSLQALASAGYQVKGFTGSKDALAEFAAAPADFDLVITDMTMPHMDGLEISRKMLEIRPDIPIIMCTGFSENISFLKAKQLGIKKLLLKPIPLMDIACVIRQLLDGCREPGRMAD